MQQDKEWQTARIYLIRGALADHVLNSDFQGKDESLEVRQTAATRCHSRHCMTKTFTAELPKLTPPPPEEDNYIILIVRPNGSEKSAASNFKDYSEVRTKTLRKMTSQWSENQHLCIGRVIPCSLRGHIFNNHRLESLDAYAILYESP
jgi:hypothetical protein